MASSRVRGRERLFTKSRLDIPVEPGIESASLYTSMYRATSTTRKGAPTHRPLPSAEPIDPGFDARMGFTAIWSVFFANPQICVRFGSTRAL